MSIKYIDMNLPVMQIRNTNLSGFNLISSQLCSLVNIYNSDISDSTVSTHFAALKWRYTNQINQLTAKIYDISQTYNLKYKGQIVGFNQTLNQWFSTKYDPNNYIRTTLQTNNLLYEQKIYNYTLMYNNYYYYNYHDKDKIDNFINFYNTYRNNYQMTFNELSTNTYPPVKDQYFIIDITQLPNGYTEPANYLAVLQDLLNKKIIVKYQNLSYNTFKVRVYFLKSPEVTTVNYEIYRLLKIQEPIDTCLTKYPIVKLSNMLYPNNIISGYINQRSKTGIQIFDSIKFQYVIDYPTIQTLQNKQKTINDYKYDFQQIEIPNDLRIYDDNNIMPLTFIATEDNSFITLKKYGEENCYISGLYYKTNKILKWLKYHLNTKISLRNKNDWIQFKNLDTRLSLNTSNYVYFDMTDSLNCMGNLLSLSNYLNTYSQNIFYNLFNNYQTLLADANSPSKWTYPLTIIADQENTTVELKQINITLNYLYYRQSINESWQRYKSNTVITLKHVNDYVQFQNSSTGLSNSLQKYVNFEFSKKVRCVGNIQSLLNYSQSCSNYCFYKLFENCTKLVKAPDLTAIQVKMYSYSQMFKNCSLLTQAPKIHALTLAKYCYTSMFQNCKLLINMPELSCESLTIGCYKSMFKNCQSLNETTILPAKTLESECYKSMFEGCSSLVYSPLVSLLTNAENSCQSMFQNCISLQATPKLNAITLAKSCYKSMFKNCQTLTEGPILSATVLVDSCYANMFENCINLSSVIIACLQWNNLNSSIDSWLTNVSVNGIFNTFNEQLIEAGKANIPDKWKIKIHENFYASRNNLYIKYLNIKDQIKKVLTNHNQKVYKLKEFKKYVNQKQNAFKQTQEKIVKYNQSLTQFIDTNYMKVKELHTIAQEYQYQINKNWNWVKKIIEAKINYHQNIFPPAKGDNTNKPFGYGVNFQTIPYSE